jgi:uncharacterized protein (DUF1778 family)
MVSFFSGGQMPKNKRVAEGKQIAIRVGVHERKTLESASQKLGLTLSAFVRAAALKEAASLK